MYLTNEVIVFTKSIIYGMGIGILLDFFRIIRKIFRHKDIIVIIQDCLFSLLVFIYVFGLIFYINQGQIRMYILIGISIGNILYFLTASKVILMFFDKFLSFFQNILMKFEKK